MSTRTEMWVRRGYKPYAIIYGKELISYPWGNGIGGPIRINARTPGDPTSMMTYDIADDGTFINPTHPNWETCQYCGKQKPDVRERPDGYAQDVNNDEDATHVACDQCDRETRDDI